MSDIGFAVIGLGMGANRAREVVATPGARLVAVCDLIQAKVDRVVAEHGCEGTLNYHELLDRDDIDVIYVMVESGNHAKVAIDAAQAGKHVLSTKPIETTPEKAESMIRACDEAGVICAVDFEMRYSPDCNQVKAAMDQGVFGDIILAEERLKWYRSDDYYDGWHGTWALDGGGSIINQTVHQVDYLCWIMGMPETARARYGVYNHDIETEDMTLAMLHYANGAEGMIVCTTTFPEDKVAATQVHGTKGGVILDWKTIDYWKTRDDMTVEVPPHPNCAADDVVKTLRDGEPLSCDGREALKSLRLIQAIYHSAQNDEKLIRVADF
jgi:predicted dehydrogenase